MTEKIQNIFIYRSFYRCLLEIVQCQAKRNGRKVPIVEREGKCNNECPHYCLEIYDPVCASNGNTFSNKCFFNIAVCNGAKITVAHLGICEKLP